MPYVVYLDSVIRVYWSRNEFGWYMPFTLPLVGDNTLWMVASALLMYSSHFGFLELEQKLRILFIAKLYIIEEN